MQCKAAVLSFTKGASLVGNPDIVGSDTRRLCSHARRCVGGYSMDGARARLSSTIGRAVVQCLRSARLSALCHLLVVVQLRSLCAAHLRDRRNDCRIGRSRVGGGRDRHVGLARPRDQEQRDLWLGALGDPFRNITRGPSGRQGRHYRPACQSLSSSRRARTCALLRTDAQRQRCRPCRPDAADLAPLGDRA